MDWPNLSHSFTIRHTAGETMSHSDTQSGLIAAEQHSVGSDSVAVVTENPNPSSQVYLAEPLPAVPPRAPKRSWLKIFLQGIGATTHWLFGFASLIVILSVLATLPILQFLSLGYLLEASGRIIRSKRLRDGFFGISTAARVGSIGLGVFFTMLPVRFFSSLWYSSYLLNGDVDQTRGLRLVVIGLCVLAFVHIAWAVFRGGKLRHFCWPAPVKLFRRMRDGDMYDEASLRLLNFFSGLRLRYFFWLGLRGFVGALVWLAIPISMMAIATKVEVPQVGGAIAFLGGLLLSTVLIYLPFLQTRLAMTNRFASQFDVNAVRQQFKRAPIAYWFSLLMTLALALPLYILKAELVPREAAWLPSLFFVAFMLPARIAVGWAVSRAERREQPRFFLVRWLSRAGLLPVTIIYAFIAYFTQFTSWHGAFSLYEQHAFLVPVPFLGY